MWKFLTSLRLAIVLIGLITILLILSALIPQSGIAEDRIADVRQLLGDSYVIVEWLGLDRIYFTPGFYVILGLLAINLTAGTIQRFRVILTSEGTLWRVRRVGSLVFHMSLLLIIVSVIVNYLVKFEGVYALSEGQEVSDAADAYFRTFNGPLHKSESGRFTLRLNEVIIDDDVARADAVAARVTFMPSDGDPLVDRVIATNHPLKYESLEVHYGLVNGFSPELLVLDSTGSRLFAGFVRLATVSAEGRRRYADFIELPQQQLTVNLEVFPAKDGSETPTFQMSVERRGMVALDTIVTTADTVTAFEYRFAVPRWRRWCYLNVVENPYLNVVFVGFWLALTGMSVGLVSRVMPAGRGVR
ncbi:MAG TPA: cytochrome c biogenesis protein ResB [Candidatus Deferrimicrobium sp.]|nr:cytochrome c biogenesis protein ResB [Candidatus Deferrimicrobium sp.]